MATYLITGSSRGLGLELVTQLLALPPTQVRLVIATARDESSPKLKELAEKFPDRIAVVELDVTSQESVDSAVAGTRRVLDVCDLELDVLINNAGGMPASPDGIQTM